MTREHKISLILGFAVVLIVGVLVSDHLSSARSTRLGEMDLVADARSPGTPGARAVESASDPSLVLVDERGRPEPLAQVAATHDASVEPAGGAGVRDRIGWIQDQFASAVTDLANGHTPPAAVRLSEPPAQIVMGRSLVDHPMVSTRPGNDAQPTPRRTTPTITNSPAPEPRERDFELYTIRAGDSLWKLAERFLGDGNRHTELAAMNEGRIGKDGTLRVGASIRVPRTGAARSTPASADQPTRAAERTPARPTPSGAASYTVQAGDTLGEIAAKTLGSSRRFREIVEANKGLIDDADDIRVGMVLRIPPR